MIVTILRSPSEETLTSTELSFSVVSATAHKVTWHKQGQAMGWENISFLPNALSLQDQDLGKALLTREFGLGHKWNEFASTSSVKRAYTSHKTPVWLDWQINPWRDKTEIAGKMAKQ